MGHSSTSQNCRIGVEWVSGHQTLSRVECGGEALESGARECNRCDIRHGIGFAVVAAAAERRVGR